MKTNRKLLIGILSLSFLFVATTTFASMTFGPDSITTTTPLVLSPNGQDVVIGDSTRPDFDLYGEVTPLMVVGPTDTAYTGVASTSDGYAFAGFNGMFKAASGDVSPRSGVLTTPGDLYSLINIWAEQNDTTDQTSWDMGISGPRTGNLSNLFAANYSGDVSLGNVSANYNSYPVNITDSNFFVEGATGNTKVKGTFTVDSGEAYLTGNDYPELFVRPVSDGYAGGDTDYTFIAQSGDKHPTSGATLTTGQTASIGWIGFQYHDTTDTKTTDFYIYQAGNGTAPINSMFVNGIGDIGLGHVNSVNGSPTNVSDANLYIVGATGNTTVKGSLTAPTIKTTPTTFASLPACAAGTKGTYATITDSNTTMWGANVAGGGANNVSVFCNGSNWTLIGK